jgi:S-adenosylmethionine hydrolase
VAILTLTTDFGIRDAYVGAMKGVVLSLSPATTLVDISHEVTAQDVMEGAYVIASAYPYFPRGTVHLVVIDPGVGSDRRGIVVETRDHWFVAPDNGVLSSILDEGTACRIVSIENTDWFRDRVSATFHGRDIFAPVAAALLNGKDVGECGPSVEDPVKLHLWSAKISQGTVEGRVVHVDQFGNCVTQIKREDMKRAGLSSGCRVTVGNHNLDGIGVAYSEVSEGSAIGLFGGRDTLEIAINGGNAAERLGIARGDKVSVRLI